MIYKQWWKVSCLFKYRLDHIAEIVTFVYTLNFFKIRVLDDQKNNDCCIRPIYFFQFPHEQLLRKDIIVVTAIIRHRNR